MSVRLGEILIKENLITSENPEGWAWKSLGTIKVMKGDNTLILKKLQTTSAAFAMDKFILSEQQLDLK